MSKVVDLSHISPIGVECIFTWEEAMEYPPFEDFSDEELDLYLYTNGEVPHFEMREV
ncbi:MAG: hypothetical protein GY861_20885 [bacterium]|nr:hypothetical protein [bacterium]